jgi:hypothetical protein
MGSVALILYKKLGMIICIPFCWQLNGGIELGLILSFNYKQEIINMARKSFAGM